MTTARLLSQNLLYYVSADVLQKMFLFFVSIALARTSVHGFGLYTIGVTAGLFLSTITDLGISNLILRDMSVHSAKESAYLKFLFPLRIALAAGTLVIFTVGLILLQLPLVDALILWLLGFIAIIESFATLLLSFFRARDEAKPIVYAKNISVLAATALLACMIWSPLAQVWNERNILYAVVFLLLAAQTINVILLLFAHKMKWGGPSFGSFSSWRWPTILELKSTIGGSFFFMLSTSFYLFLSRSSIVILSLFLGTVGVGLFTGAYTIISVAFILVSLFVFVFYRTITVFTLDKKRRGSIRLLIKYIFVTTIPLTIILFLFSTELLTFLFGAEYAAAASALKILSFMFPILFLSQTAQIILVSLGKQKNLAFIIGVSMVLAYGVGYFLVKSYGLVGGAVIILLGEGIIFLSTQYINNKSGISLLPTRHAWRVFGANIVLFVILYLSSIQWWIEIITSPFLYALLLVIMRSGSIDDYNLLSDIPLIGDIVKWICTKRIKTLFFGSK